MPDISKVWQGNLFPGQDPAPPHGTAAGKQPAADAVQIFRAWDRLGVALGVTTPKQLNRATFYRARLDNIVR